MRGIGAGDQRLGRRAAGVDAGAAEQVALDQRDLHAGAGQPAGERRPGLAGADDDRVEGAVQLATARARRSGRRRRSPPHPRSGRPAGRGRRPWRARRAQAAPPSVPITAPIDAGDQPGDQHTAGRAERGAGKRADDDAGAELDRHLAARRRGQLVGDQLAERQHRQDAGRPDRSRGRRAAFRQGRASQARPPSSPPPARSSRAGRRRCRSPVPGCRSFDFSPQRYRLAERPPAGTRKSEAAVRFKSAGSKQNSRPGQTFGLRETYSTRVQVCSAATPWLLDPHSQILTRSAGGR